MLISPRVEYAIRSLGGWRTKHWREVAVENWVLAPAETRDNPAPVCIEGQLDKVRALKQEWFFDPLKFFSPAHTHKATTAHLLRNVELTGTSLFSGRMQHVLSDFRPPIFDRQPVERIASGVLASGYSGNKWFGHFLTDTAPMCLMASDVAADRHAEVIGAPMVTDMVGQRKRYLDLFEGDARTVSRAHFDEVVIIDPLGLNSYHRSKMQEMRRRIRNSIQPSFGNHNIYLRRGTHGESRNAQNEEQIEAVLSEQGFHILEPETMTVDSLVATMLDARLIVGIEGSQLFHSLLSAADRATILTLQPPYRFAAPIKAYSEQIGMKWGFLIGHRREVKNYVIDLDELRRTLDVCLAENLNSL